MVLTAKIFDYGVIPVCSKVSSEPIKGLPWKNTLHPNNKSSPKSSSILSHIALVLENKGIIIYSSLYWFDVTTFI